MGDLERQCERVRNLGFATGHAEDAEDLLLNLLWQLEEKQAMQQGSDYGSDDSHKNE